MIDSACGAFSCLYADTCNVYQAIGFAACSGHPYINPDGECANFMCECCSDLSCHVLRGLVAVYDLFRDSDSAIH